MASNQGSMTLISGKKPDAAPLRMSSQPQQISDNVVATYPLTHSQEGIWVDYVADIKSTRYNLTLELVLNVNENQIGSSIVDVFRSKS